MHLFWYKIQVLCPYAIYINRNFIYKFFGQEPFINSYFLKQYIFKSKYYLWVLAPKPLPPTPFTQNLPSACSVLFLLPSKLSLQPPSPALLLLLEFGGTSLYLVQGLPYTFPKKCVLDDLVCLTSHFSSNLTELFCH